ncbi:hypothetical protein [Azospirillum thermophilum]|uniref:hypothetical protein n=1 Tax=Azospirillum thermophilum TaxID=2202148 RepID=UPI0015E887E1|nr:hypothetical protein [Azospirillum thermophilum]
MIRSNAYLTLALLSLLIAAPRAAHADQATNRNSQIASCAALAESRPEEAMETATRWQQAGGGDLAGLCQALALFHQGAFKEAGSRLEELAPRLGRDDPKAAASILGRAGWAWLRAGDQTRAERLYTDALARQPGDVDLLIDRAFARAEAERYWDAVADLDAALVKDPSRADAWLYRASAHKALMNSRQALGDIARALELKPGDPEAILLRANVKAMSGDFTAAREDWVLLRRIAPDSEQGRAAAANLERLAKLEASGTVKPAKPGKPADQKAPADPQAKPQQ